MSLLLILLALDGNLMLKRTVVVDADIHLHDVLTSESRSLLSKQGVANLKVAAAPAYNQRRMVLRGDVEAAIRRVKPNAAYAWKGPSGVLVSRETVAADMGLVEDAVRLWLEALVVDDGTVHVDKLVLPNVNRIPRGEQTVDVRATSSFKPYGRHTLAVDLRVDGKLIRTLHPQVTLSLETLVGKAISEIPRGVPLQEDQFAWSYQRLQRMIGDPITPSSLKDSEARSHIRAGAMLTNRHIKPLQVIKRGEPVTVIAQLEGLRVTLRGEAMHDAGYGQNVSVKNSQSGKTMVGVVHRDGAVHLRLN